MVDEIARLPVVPTDMQLVIAAIAGSREWGISLWDALIIRAAEAAGCRRLLSEDLAHGAVYGSIRVENPFVVGAAS
jgi:predicted nucleic acid-binding protein